MCTSRLCLSLISTPDAFLSVASSSFFMSRFSTDVLALMFVRGVPVEEANPLVDDLDEPSLSPLAAALAAFSLRRGEQG